MDYKKSKAPSNTVTRDVQELWKSTGNIYESVAEFASYNDSLDEVFENREQIEISRYYEKLPKPTLLATQEFLDGNVYWRDPSKDGQEEEDF